MVFSLPSASFLFLCICLLRSISTSPYTFDTSSRRTSGTWLGALGPMDGGKTPTLRNAARKRKLSIRWKFTQLLFENTGVKSMFGVIPVR